MEVVITNTREWRRWMQRLAPAVRADVARKLLAVAARWPVGMPLVRDLREGLFEVRCAGGIRIYLVHVDDELRILTAGRKDTQQRDIERARGRMP